MSPKCNRVQRIRSKFETLNDDRPKFIRNNSENLHKIIKEREKLTKTTSEPIPIPTKVCLNELLSDKVAVNELKPSCSKIEIDETVFSQVSAESNNFRHINANDDELLAKCSEKPSFLYKNKGLSRQGSDPVTKKLHRSHAFRRDRNQKSFNLKKQGSLSPEKPTCKLDNDISEEKLAKLEIMLDNKLRNEMNHSNIVPFSLLKSDSEIPKHILDQYAKVNKKSKNLNLNKTDLLNTEPKEAEKSLNLEDESPEQALTDSGVSSETENNNELEVNPKIRLRRLISQFESSKTDNSSNLNMKCNLQNPELYASNETIRLERKNPHIKLTDTLKKALKQPLPPGPPPKKPPRALNAIEMKKSPKLMLDKLEKALEERSRSTKTSESRSENIYDIAEADESSKLNQKLSPETNIAVTLANCFNSLNCGIVRTSTIGYSRLGSNPNSLCSDSDLDSPEDFKTKFSTFFQNKNEPKSKFYLEDEEHIYCEPFEVGIKVNMLDNKKNDIFNSLKTQQNGSKTKYRSLEDIRTHYEDTKIYDIPCEVSRPPSPVTSEFETKRKTHLYGSLRKPVQKQSETTPSNTNSSKPSPNGTISTKVIVRRRPKPVDLPRICSKSLEILDKSDDGLKPKMNGSCSEEINRSMNFTEARRSLELKFATESSKTSRKYEKNTKKCHSHTKLNSRDSDDFKQLKIDKENLNKLMCEIYERVSNDMDLLKPGKFPTNSSEDNTSEESVKLKRSLTEKRKRYLRRVSSIHNTKRRLRHQTSVCSNYGSDVKTTPIRSWRSFSIILRSPDGSFDVEDDVSNDVSADVTVTDDVSDRLMDMCLYVCLGNGGPFIKSRYPNDATPPAFVEKFIFPDVDRLHAPWQHNQEYIVVLTNEIGDRGYLYARRVLPEGSTICLPAAYCLITRKWDPDFYYKVLKEIEQRHGYTQSTHEDLLRGFYDSKYPLIDQSISIAVNQSIEIVLNKYKFRNSINLGDTQKEKGISVCLDRSNSSETLCSNSRENLRLDIINITRTSPTYKSLNILIETLGVSTTVKMFTSLLLERKVIIMGDKLSTLSSCIEGIIFMLYPLSWQHPLVSLAPKDIVTQLISAPIPLVATVLKFEQLEIVEEDFVDGMLIDATLETKSKIVHCAGDESTIVPSRLYRTLKAYLQQIVKDTAASDETRGIMLFEGFQRFFQQVFNGFQTHYTEENQFDRESFTKNAPNKQMQFFYEWFAETSMFDQFIQNARISHDLYEPFLTRLGKVDEKSNKGISVLKNVWDIFNK